MMMQMLSYSTQQKAAGNLAGLSIAHVKGVRQSVASSSITSICYGNFNDVP